MAEQWTADELRMRFETLQANAQDYGVRNGTAIQCTLDLEDLDWILKQGRFAPACTCTLVSPATPWDPADLERDVFCPAHHVPLEELRDMYMSVATELEMRKDPGAW